MVIASVLFCLENVTLAFSCVSVRVQFLHVEIAGFLCYIAAPILDFVR